VVVVTRVLPEAVVVVTRALPEAVVVVTRVLPEAVVVATHVLLEAVAVVTRALPEVAAVVIHVHRVATSTDPLAGVVARVRRNCHPVVHRARAPVVADGCRQRRRNARPVVTVDRSAVVCPICLRLAAVPRSCRLAIVRAQAPAIVLRNFPRGLAVRIVPVPVPRAGPRNFPPNPVRESQAAPEQTPVSAQARATSAISSASPVVPRGVLR
jgi:hypothetical protein